MDTTNRRISENVVVLMHRRKMDQTTLANKTHMSRMSISQRITGRTAWKAADMERVASALGVPVAQLFDVLPSIEEWDSLQMTTAGHSRVTGSRTGGDGGI